MSRRRQKLTQLELDGTQKPVLRGRGGARPGAGRPRLHHEGIAHRRRPSISPRLPVRVTLRMAERVFNLRSQRSFRVVERALFATTQRRDARIVHFSVQGNHLHLLVEADDRRALSSAMRSLGIRIGLGMNLVMRSSGRVVAHRYHARALRTPTEVYRALAYVRHNRAVHAARRGEAPRPSVDAYSSDAATLSFTPPAPKTWLLSTGWRRGAPKGVSSDSSVRPRLAPRCDEW